MKKKLIYLFLLLFFISGCSIFQTITNVKRLKFRLINAVNYNLAGVDLTNKKRLSDFSTIETLKLTAAAAKGSLPLTFLLNVDAKNPNDGTGGYPKTDIALKAFPYRLLINDKETITGDISHPLEVPGVGESTVIPLNINIDLMKFFKNKNYEDIVNLVLKLSNSGGSASNLKLYAKPVIATPLGDLQYPDEITIVDNTFN